MLRSIANAVLGRREPADPRVWHKWETLFPVRLSNGTVSDESQLWRRWNGSSWEYKQDGETVEEWSVSRW